MWAVMCMEEFITVHVDETEYDVPLSWAFGMSGAIPTFEYREDAERYSNGRYEIREFITTPMGES